MQDDAGAGVSYTDSPSWTSPYNAGVLADAYHQDGVDYANFARYLADVPDDLTPIILPRKAGGNVR